MRSGLLFRAADQISNRYLLCRMISASARKMNRDGISTSQCINRSLLALNGTQPNLPAEEKRPAAQPSDAGAVETQDTQVVTSGNE